VTWRGTGVRTLTGEPFGGVHAWFGLVADVKLRPDRSEPIGGNALRTPRAAAIAGIVFALLLGFELVILILASPDDATRSGTWLTEHRHRAAVALAVNLVPFAGIAFLWFIGVVRDRIGDDEDRFFATIFLGSGLLFVAMLFVAAALAGGLISHAATQAQPQGDTLAVNREVTSVLVRVYAMRMAGVFTLNAAAMTLRTGAISRWISIVGLVCAVTMLVTLGLTRWVELIFPGWILLVSIDILRAPAGGRAAPAAIAADGRAAAS
jgi:hypothetical protein